jgi:hypothetical protein
VPSRGPVIRRPYRQSRFRYSRDPGSGASSAGPEQFVSTPGRTMAAGPWLGPAAGPRGSPWAVAGAGRGKERSMFRGGRGARRA